LLFPVTEKMLKQLSYQKSNDSDFIGNVDKKIEYYGLYFSDIKENIIILNRLVKEILNSDRDYYDLQFSSKQRFYAVFTSLEETPKKDIDVTCHLLIKKEQHQETIPKENIQKNENINGIIRVKIAKIIQAVVKCEFQGKNIVIDVEPEARSMQIVTLVSMIAIDYYKNQLDKKNIIQKEIISDFYYRSKNISERCCGKLRDSELKTTLKKRNPDDYQNLIELCRNCFPGFEQFNGNKNINPRDYSFLQEKSPKKDYLW